MGFVMSCDLEKFGTYYLRTRAMGVSQALSTGIYAVMSTQGTGEPTIADDLPHE
jgi:hypothetical protein